MKSEISRRTLLKGSAGSVAALVAGPWLLRAPERLRPAASAVEAAALRALGRTVMRLPGSLPDATKPAGVDTLPEIKHILVLMMENHSYDNFFGMLGKGDGFTLDAHGHPTATNPNPDGSLQRAFHMPTTCQLSGKPSQEWTASHVAWNYGKLDGFVRAPISNSNSDTVGPVAMGYWTRHDLPFTYGLANAFPIGDRWFCSTMCQTYPNRRFLMAGTSTGMTNDNVAQAPTKASNGTIFEQFELHKISWLNYAVSYPTGASPELYASDDSALEANHHAPFDQFFTDAKHGKLPAFSLLDPNYSTQSQENPQNIVIGEAMLRRVVEAVGHSPEWRHTLLAIMYDEHGGYYDHVPPPQALAPDSVPPILGSGEQTYGDSFTWYGFRVPSVIVSPYSKPGHVSHRLHDHTSVLAMLERKWNLPALTKRDANAHDLMDFLDVRALRNQKPTFPELPKLPHSGDTKATRECSTTGPGQIPP